MTENQTGSFRDQQGYDAGQDPDADPDMLESRELADQPDQAEGDMPADESEDRSS